MQLNVRSMVLVSASAVSLAAMASCGGAHASRTAEAPCPEQSRTQPSAAPAPGREAAAQASPASPRASGHDAEGKPASSARAEDRMALAGVPGFELAPTGAARMAYDGTDNLRQVSDAAEGADFDPSISPDGTRVYFSSTRHSSTSDLFVKSIDGSAITQLTSHPAQDVMPAVSPDGKRLAFASNRHGSWDIFVMSTDGGQAMQITSDSAAELHPSWSPDNDKLTFCRLNEASQRWEVWVTSVSRPSFRQFLTYGLFPAWQPGGNKIAFQRARERGSRYFSVWTVEYTGGEGRFPTEIASSPDRAITNPAWSPDGNLLACVSLSSAAAAAGGAPAEAGSEYGQTPDFADIWIVTADGRARTNLTGGRFVNLMPAWGSGSTVYFASDRAGPRNIWSLDARQAMASAGITPSGTATASGAAGSRETAGATDQGDAGAAMTARPQRTPRDAPRLAMPPRPAPAEHAAAPEASPAEPTETQTTDAAPSEHEEAPSHP